MKHAWGQGGMRGRTGEMRAPSATGDTRAWLQKWGHYHNGLMAQAQGDYSTNRSQLCGNTQPYGSPQRDG
jgi:hypothetical protein